MGHRITGIEARLWLLHRLGVHESVPQDGFFSF